MYFTICKSLPRMGIGSSIFHFFWFHGFQSLLRILNMSWAIVKNTVQNGHFSQGSAKFAYVDRCHTFLCDHCWYDVILNLRLLPRFHHWRKFNIIPHHSSSLQSLRWGQLWGNFPVTNDRYYSTTFPCLSSKALKLPLWLYPPCSFCPIWFNRTKEHILIPKLFTYFEF